MPLPPNLTLATTSRTTKVSVPPIALTVARHHQPESRRVNQWRTMPACDSVKQTNTPTEYRGIRACVSPSKMTIRPPAIVASTMMPHEKARRSPRNENWRGMNPSSARMAASRGKALKLVLTARKRMRAVAAWKATKRADPSPNTDAATMATTV